MAEGERTDETREHEGDPPSDEQRSGSSGDSDDVPGGASVPASGVADADPPHEQEDESKFSSEDAMGQDKRRTIIGQGYGPSRGRQLLYYGVSLAVVVALFIGASIAVDQLDKAPAKDKDAAPWTGTQVPAKQFE